MRHVNEYGYQEYLRKESWKCNESPNGAHYWRGTQLGVFTCKYCDVTKQFILDASYAKFQIGRKKKNDNKNN